MQPEKMKWYRKFTAQASAFPYMMTLAPPVQMECSDKDKDRGDPHPVIEKTGDPAESDDNGYRIVSSGAPAMITRHVGGLFPFTAFHMGDLSVNGESGISVYVCRKEKPRLRVDVFLETCLEEEQRFGLRVTEDGAEIRNEYLKTGKDGRTGILRQYELGFRTGTGMGETNDAFFDLIAGYGSGRRVIGSFCVPELCACADSASQHAFQTALYLKTRPEKRAALLKKEPALSKALPQAQAEGRIDQISSYRPVGFADPRPVRYTDGSPVLINGRMMLSVSARMAAGAYQMILSWLPGTGDFTQEGALFFEYGDGRISADVASSILYDREKERFLIWNCSFSHGHVLAHGECAADLLHGLHIVRMERMETKEGSADTEFYAREGDEDPDFYYDGERKQWILSVCRLADADGKYHFFRFRSAAPFSGYVFEERTDGDHETGGSFVKTPEGRRFICGADGGRPSVYYIYDAEDFTRVTEAAFDRPDGGFRGWGTVIPVPCGSFTRWYWITFDRIRGSAYNWSYGNLYVFEGGTEDGGMPLL